MKKKIHNAESLEKIALKALKEAVNDTIKDHAKTGDPIVIFEDGKVTKVFARNIRGGALHAGPNDKA